MNVSSYLLLELGTTGNWGFYDSDHHHPIVVGSGVAPTFMLLFEPQCVRPPWPAVPSPQTPCCGSFTLIGAAADDGGMVFGIIRVFKRTTNDFDKKLKQIPTLALK